MIELRNDSTEMTVEEMKGYLSVAYISMIKKGKDLKRFPSVMLWGAPGVGKSQGVRQVAKLIEEGTGKTVVVTDVRLLLFNPVDLRGIPIANEDKTLAVWLKPHIFQMNDSADVVNILFLDEISAAPPSVQASAYQITLDRTIGEHRLPDNCIVIAAGNRVTDKSVAYNMPKALANRLLHIDVRVDVDSWLKWAVNAGVNKVVTGFISQNPTLLSADLYEVEGNAFPTPRSWEMVSNILNDVSDDISKVFPLIKGCIGGRVAYLLRTYGEVFFKIADPAEICNGGNVGVPVRAEALFATVSALTDYLRDHSDRNGVDNAVAYGFRIPHEFREKLFESLYSVKALRPLLYENKAFSEWLDDNGL